MGAQTTKKSFAAAPSAQPVDNIIHTLGFERGLFLGILPLKFLGLLQFLAILLLVDPFLGNGDTWVFWGGNWGGEGRGQKQISAGEPIKYSGLIVSGALSCQHQQSMSTFFWLAKLDGWKLCNWREGQLGQGSA